MTDSIVITPSRERKLSIRESYLEICGDRSAAILLSILEYWTAHEHREQKIRKRENTNKAKEGIDDLQPVNDSLWIRRTRKDLANDSFGLLNEKNVTASAQKLEDLGLIETGYPYREQGDNAKHYRMRLDRINDLMRQQVLEAQEADHQRESDIQSKEERRRKKEDPEDDTYWEEDDWQYKYADRWWDRQDSLGEGRIAYTWREKKEKILQNWADAFDWMTRVHDVPRDVLDDLIVWLYEEEGWWIPSGNLVAPTKFKKKNDQGKYRYEEWIMKMKIDKSGGPGQDYSIPDEGGEVPDWKMQKIVENNDEVSEDDFLSCGWTEDGTSKLYAYQP